MFTICCSCLAGIWIDEYERVHIIFQVRVLMVEICIYFATAENVYAMMFVRLIMEYCDPGNQVEKIFRRCLI